MLGLESGYANIDVTSRVEMVPMIVLRMVFTYPVTISGFPNTILYDVSVIVSGINLTMPAAASLAGVNESERVYRNGYILKHAKQHRKNAFATLKTLSAVLLTFIYQTPCSLLVILFVILLTPTMSTRPTMDLNKPAAVAIL